jgi:DNA-binding MarR family transcriptional regulator
MIDGLRKRLKQTKPFANEQEEAALAIQVLAEDHRAALEGTFKSSDLTGPQYNVLRILRGAGAVGLCCREISDRMITRDPDITRMLDRLEARKLVMRERHAAVRRVINVAITDAGRAMLKGLDAPLARLQKTLFSNISKADLASLARILAKMLKDSER